MAYCSCAVQRRGCRSSQPATYPVCPVFRRRFPPQKSTVVRSSRASPVILAAHSPRWSLRLALDVALAAGCRRHEHVSIKLCTAAAADGMGLDAAHSGDWPAHHQSSSGNGASDAVPHSASTVLLSTINELTKWAVSMAVFAVLLLRRDVAVAWCVLGSIIASFLNKALKYVINEQRPPSARKADPGMPSSHANSLAFLGVYTALALAQGAAPVSTGSAAAAAISALSVFLTWLRVRLGYHTFPQVLVGYGLGAATAVAWYQLGTGHALKALAERPEQRLALYGCTALAVALFAVRNVMAWFKERGVFHGRSGLSKAELKAA
ncbi:hypothetical protein Vretimale_7744 [Volvox reticuliferus]|uniref:Phosphatidic acid phosphatase type 2/haloperoxidase domain-containing protein n=1 Tax=Volvox reticuliferus TaxID=1737510 RepID=A0A8J4GA07_9CHLO|nr:hypothetical protein Vretifemale_4893 [Volvox reticuliferus]GIM02930.1 hypothetical protein Vretimale_7744 [Volvox reticuliferus]